MIAVGKKSGDYAMLERAHKALSQSTCPTLRHISPEFGCYSGLRHSHPGKISHKL